MYSELEVIRMLINNNNQVMDLLEENKQFRINHETKEVECWRVRRIFPDKLLGSETFKSIILEAGGKHNERKTS